MAYTHFLIFCAVLSTASVWSLPHGAPNSACAFMEPKHPGPDGSLIQSQTTPAPYKLKLESNTVSAGDPLNIELIATGDVDIKGFLIQARLDDKPVGAFSVDQSDGHAQLLNCNGEGDSLTHRETREAHVKSIKFQWTPGNDLKGKTVKFYGTLAASYATFWMKGVVAEVQVI